MAFDLVQSNWKESSGLSQLNLESCTTYERGICMKRCNINSERIFVFATRKSKLADELEDNVREIIKHLIKLWVYPDSTSADHWIQEIYDFLHKVPKLKNTKKYPSKKFILQNTIKMNYEDIDNLVYIVLTNYRGERVLDYEVSDKMKEHIEEYFDWLATNLSIYGEVAKPDLYSKLKYLGFGEVH